MLLLLFCVTSNCWTGLEFNSSNFIAYCHRNVALLYIFLCVFTWFFFIRMRTHFVCVTSLNVWCFECLQFNVNDCVEFECRNCQTNIFEWWISKNRCNSLLKEFLEIFVNGKYKFIMLSTKLRNKNPNLTRINGKIWVSLNSPRQQQQASKRLTFESCGVSHFFFSLHTSCVCVCVRSRVNKYIYIAIFNVQSPTLTYSTECHFRVFLTLAQISLFIHFAPFCLSTVSFCHQSNSCKSIFFLFS